MWTQAFFSLDSSAGPLSPDTCYVQEGIPWLTQASEEERRNRVTALVPPEPLAMPWDMGLGPDRPWERKPGGGGRAARAKLSVCGAHGSQSP